MIARSLMMFLCFMACMTPASRAAPVRFQSTQPGASDADAIASAIVEAAGTFVPLLRQRVELELRKDRFSPQTPDQATLQTLIASKLADGRFITARQVDKQSRPYGDVYYATLTLDPPSGWLDELTRRAASMARLERRRDVTSIAGVVTLLVTVCLGYLAANTVTKGYYRTRLRVLAMTTAVAGIVVVAAAFHRVPGAAQLTSQLTIERAWPN